MLEDYTELIADLIAHRGKARVCDIARELGISHVSVLKTLNRLIKEGFLTKDSHQVLHLTEEGKQMAALSKKKHLILFEFLKYLGVPEEVAATDVEGMEHHISPMTLKAIETYLAQKTGITAPL